MDEFWRDDDGNHNHHGTHIEEMTKRNSQGSRADTIDKNLFAINDTLILPNNT